MAPKNDGGGRAATVVTTYERLREYVRAFAEGHLNLLILVGPPGVQKTRIVQDAVGESGCRLTGRVTALQLYRELYEHRDEPIVIDDVDELYADRKAVSILRCLCQTDPIKTVAWHSTTSELRRDGIPNEFKTTSRLVIIGNVWRTLGENVAALEDRGHLIHFEPPAEVIHRTTAKWFRDQEVFDFIGQHLHLIARPSMRQYELAEQTKRAGLDWREQVLSWCLTGKRLLVARLLADPSFHSVEARAQEFQARGAGCRATFFNIARTLRPAVEVPRIVLDNPLPDENHPPATPPQVLRLPTLPPQGLTPDGDGAV